MGEGDGDIVIMERKAEGKVEWVEGNVVCPEEGQDVRQLLWRGRQKGRLGCARPYVY